MKDKIQQFVGKKGIIIASGLTVNVKILDYKTAYGKERWLVTPVSGAGEVWVQSVDIIDKLKEI
jgi:hypothetical protein